MSMHYDFALACDLKPDTPQQVIDTLAYLTRDEDYPFDNPPTGDFFDGNDWRNMLQGSIENTYFPGNLGRTFRRAYRFTQNGVDNYRYTLAFRCYMVDEEFYEVMPSFTAWLAPYSENVGYVGYFREETDWQPMLVYFKEGKVYLSERLPNPVSTKGEVW